MLVTKYGLYIREKKYTNIPSASDVCSACNSIPQNIPRDVWLLLQMWVHSNTLDNYRAGWHTCISFRLKAYILYNTHIACRYIFRKSWYFIHSAAHNLLTVYSDFAVIGVLLRVLHKVLHKLFWLDKTLQHVLPISTRPFVHSSHAIKQANKMLAGGFITQHSPGNSITQYSGQP